MAIELVTDQARPEPTPSKAQHLAILLGSLEELRQEKAEYLAGWRSREQRLQLRPSV